MHAQEAGAEISRIKDLWEKIKFDVKLKLAREHKDLIMHCSAQPLRCLIKEYNAKSRKARVSIRNFERMTNIKNDRNYALACNSSTASKAVKEVM